MGLFGEAKSKYWSKVIRIDTVSGAKSAVRKLSQGWRTIRRGEKVKRIKYAVLAMNRAKALLRKRNLSQKERRELKAVIKVYEEWVRKHRLRR